MEVQPVRSIVGASPVRKDSRSAVTNGKRLHVKAPGNTAWARRFRDVLAGIIANVGPDLSEGQRQLARRAATMCIQCERMEGEAAAGNDIDLQAYGELSDRLGRAFVRLGLSKSAKEVTELTFNEYLARGADSPKPVGSFNGGPGCNAPAKTETRTSGRRRGRREPRGGGHGGDGS